MSQATWHALARRELFEAADFYEERVLGLGEAFIDDVETAVARIRQYPRLGAIALREIRQLAIVRFPYYVVYKVLPARIMILAIAHQRRRPRYWANRAS